MLRLERTIVHMGIVSRGKAKSHYVFNHVTGSLEPIVPAGCSEPQKIQYIEGNTLHSRTDFSSYSFLWQGGALRATANPRISHVFQVVKTVL